MLLCEVSEGCLRYAARAVGAMTFANDSKDAKMNNFCFRAILVQKLQIECFPRIFLILTGTIWFGALSIRAADYYVATNGAGQGTNGWADATNDLQGAITACASNWTVWVSNGTYVGSFTNGAGVTVKSKDNDPATVILDGGYPALTNRVMLMTASSQLIGCTVTNGRASAGAGIYGEFTSIVSNCLITGNTASGLGGGIRRCSVYNSIINGNKADGGGGGQANAFYNSLITLNAATNGSGGGVYSGNLFNSTIVSNTAITSGGGGYDCYFNNSISWDNSKVDTGADWTNRYSCGVGYVTPTSTTNDPLFVNPNAGIYRLQSSSPCINAGNNGLWAGLANSFDLAENLRIRFGRVDMGAYEWYPRIKVNGVPYERIRFVNGVEPRRIDGIP